MPDSVSQESSGNPSILMVAGEYPPALGGVGDYTELLCGHLAKMGARVCVLTRAGMDARGAQDDIPGVQVLRAVRSWGPTCWGQVVDAMSKFPSQIVHIQYQAAAYAMNPAANTMPAFLRARLPQARVVTTFHDLRVPYLFPKAGKIREAAIRAMDRLSHATVLTDQADLDQLQGSRSARVVTPPRRWLIPLGSSIEKSPPPGYDRGEWRSRMDADDGTLVISYFGLMNQSKGAELLVEALDLLLQRSIKTRLLVIGGEPGDSDPTNSAYLEGIRQSIATRRLESAVVWTGFASPQQVSAHLLSSDLCVLPFRDGVSLRRSSLVAALAHGLAIVTTLPNGSEPLLRNGENVAMVRRDDALALANASEYLWRDEGRRSRLSAGATTLAQQFQWSEIASKHMEMYASLLRREVRPHRLSPGSVPRAGEDQS